MSRLTDSQENVYANIDLVMNILSECIVGGTRTCRNLGTSAAKIAHSSAKENLDLRGGKIRIDEAMNDRSQKS